MIKNINMTLHDAIEKDQQELDYMIDIIEQSDNEIMCKQDILLMLKDYRRSKLHLFEDF